MDLEDVAQIIGIVRDGVLLLALLIGILVMLMLYRKVSSIFNAVSRTMDMASGAGRVTDFLAGLSRRKKKGG